MKELVTSNTKKKYEIKKGRNRKTEGEIEELARRVADPPGISPSFIGAQSVRFKPRDEEQEAREQEVEKTCLRLKPACA